jgi:ubiquinol-cytochrome c reductase cytochrome c1 subunit
MMKTLKQLALGFTAVLALSGTGVYAATTGIAWDKAPPKTNDVGALQNGAKLFVNYCLNCHSAAFMRYNRLKDINLTEQQIKDNLLFATDKVGETMKASIDPKQAKDWFGANPPDLTVVARSRAGQGGTGADYLYTYMRTFYRDDTTATGWNNLAFPSVAMPHVLWELSGERKPLFDTKEEHGHKVSVFKGWEQVTPAVDGRARPEYPHPGGCLGTAFSADVDLCRLAPERRVLERRQVIFRRGSSSPAPSGVVPSTVPLLCI